MFEKLSILCCSIIAVSLYPQTLQKKKVCLCFLSFMCLCFFLTYNFLYIMHISSNRAEIKEICLCCMQISIQKLVYACVSVQSDSRIGCSCLESIVSDRPT